MATANILGQPIPGIFPPANGGGGVDPVRIPSARACAARADCQLAKPGTLGMLWHKALPASRTELNRICT